MDVRALGSEIVEFLDAPRYGVISTIDPDVGTWQAVVWYMVTDDGILMNARDGRRWLANLRRDARLSLVVADGEDYVMLRGTAVVTDDLERGQVDAASLARQYRSEESFAGQRRVSVVFHPQRIGLHGELRHDDPAS